jgi:hypothetical protein
MDQTLRAVTHHLQYSKWHARYLNEAMCAATVSENTYCTARNDSGLVLALTCLRPGPVYDRDEFGSSPHGRFVALSYTPHIWG